MKIKFIALFLSFTLLGTGILCSPPATAISSNYSCSFSSGSSSNSSSYSSIFEKVFSARRISSPNSGTITSEAKNSDSKPSSSGNTAPTPAADTVIPGSDSEIAKNPIDSNIPVSGAITEANAADSSPSDSGTAAKTSTAVEGSPAASASVPATTVKTTSTYKSTDSHYNKHEKPVVDSFRASFDGSLAQTLVGRAIWYMEYGFIKYGHSKYATTGYSDCSNFVSMVYKDFGYSITSAAKNYDKVGVKVPGVYAKKKTGSSKYTLVGVEKLKPGDIFTFWNSDAPARTHIGHVAIYMGVINGKPCIINTCKGNPTAIGIINDFSYWYGSSLIEVRRVLPDSAFKPGGKITDKGPVIPAKYQIKPDQPIIMPRDLSTGF